MLILTLRTDKPLAEIALWQDSALLVEKKWEAHRQLAETLHQEINQLLNQQGKDWPDIQAIVCYQGPGSFTGLRIGLSVANALADSLSATIVSVTGQNWQQQGITKIINGEDQKIVLPDYGAPVHITQQRK